MNQSVIKSLGAPITEYPAGLVKENGEGKKKVLIFSPHPDDDVICMAGTMTKLVKEGHEVHVAYQTSGNIGVFDHDAMRFANFVMEFAKYFKLENSPHIEEMEKLVKSSLKNKIHGENDSFEVLGIKGLIRKTEAKSAALSCGLVDEHIYNLDLPFYETGKVKKNPIGPKDIQLVKELIQKVKPDQIYAAGDLTDPHGTHRLCLRAVLCALDQLEKEEAALYNDCEIYLYRGAWQELELE